MADPKRAERPRHLGDV